MESLIRIRKMKDEKDIKIVHQGLEKHNIGKPLDYITRCWSENISGERITLIAFYGDEFAGWLHLLKKSNYPFFVEMGIPEINNFDVVPPLRRRGIGNALMEEIENIAFKTSRIVGIGVGLYSDYGNAQRLYVKRGYIPDGRGVSFNNKLVKPGDMVKVDDDLVLFLTKQIKDAKTEE